MDDCPLSSCSSFASVLSWFNTTGNEESLGWVRHDCPSHLNISGRPRVGELPSPGLSITGEDLCCSGTVATDKVSTRESVAASHCPQPTSSASVLQMCHFLLSSVLTCIHEESKTVQIYLAIFVYLFGRFYTFRHHKIGIVRGVEISKLVLGRM